MHRDQSPNQEIELWVQSSILLHLHPVHHSLVMSPSYKIDLTYYYYQNIINLGMYLKSLTKPMQGWNLHYIFNLHEFYVTVLDKQNPSIYNIQYITVKEEADKVNGRHWCRCEVNDPYFNHLSLQPQRKLQLVSTSPDLTAGKHRYSIHVLVFLLSHNVLI